MTRSHRSAIALFCAASVLGACATATRGTKEGLNVITQPPGARALTDIPSTSRSAIDGFIGCEPTPCAMSVPRRAQPVVTVSLSGHQPIRYKVTSAVATSATSVPTGALVAGSRSGSHVVAGRPALLDRIPVGGQVVASGVFSLGVGTVVDVASGANRNLAPNPVTIILAPLGAASEPGAAGPLEP